MRTGKAWNSLFCVFVKKHAGFRDLAGLVSSMDSPRLHSTQGPSRIPYRFLAGNPFVLWRSMGAFHMSLEIHGGQDFPAQWAAHRRVQFADGPPLAEFSQQLHLPGLAGGILVGTGLP